MRWTWPSTRWRRRCAGRPTAVGCTRHTTPERRSATALAEHIERSRRLPSTSDAIERQVGPITVTGDGPLVVREKTHPADPMTLDQALYEMELVGHDFYLFVDKESERPCVVYRRRGYDYGVISLDLASTD